MAKPIGTLGTIPTLEIAGRVFTDLDNLKVITMQGSAAPNTYNGFSDDGGLTQYQVPIGKVLRILAVRVFGGGASSIGGQVQYADTSIGVGASTTPGTNSVQFFIGFAHAQGAGIEISAAVDWEVPAQKYLQANYTDTENMIVYGYEE